MTQDKDTPQATRPQDGKKKKVRDKIEIASDDSFPCSDPPGWIRVHAAPDNEESDST